MEAKKKRGRPKGSRNNTPVGHIVVVPPGCRRCGSHDLAVVPGSKTRVLLTAFRHSQHGLVKKQVIHRVKCGECGSVTERRTYYTAKE